jgi:biofilm protein TabA
MIFGKLGTPSTYYLKTSHLVWNQTLNLLSNLSHNTPLGITKLNEKEMFVNVHSYNTKFESDCRFEGHQNMIDVQYIIKGGEFIDWYSKEDLEEDGLYDEEKDFQFYKCPSKLSGTRICLKARYFAIFFPEDGHRPQINDGQNDSVLKAVVKIHRELLT